MKPEGIIMLYEHNIVRNVIIMLLFVFWLHYFHVLLTACLFIFCLLFFVLVLIISLLFFLFLCLFFLFAFCLVPFFIPYFRYMIWMDFFKTKYSLDSLLLGLWLVVIVSDNHHGGVVSIILWFVINYINQINIW